MVARPARVRRIAGAGGESSTVKRHLIPACLLIGLSACGGSGTSVRVVTRTVTAPTGARAPTSSASTPTQTTTAASTPPSTTAGTQPCTARDLTLSFLGQQGAAGHGELGFALKNTSSAPCHTFGYPGIQFLDKRGNALGTIPHHTTTDYFGHAPETELTIAPGDTASFRLGVTHGAIPGSVCSTADGLQVIPPDDVNSVRTQIPGGAYECRDATVSPLQAGDSAYR
jgi:hypothetical protein